MQVEYAVIAETAQINGDGTVNATRLGLRDARAPVAPATLQSLALVACCRFDPDEFDREHPIAAHFVTPEGEVLAAAVAHVTPTAANSPGDGEPAFIFAVISFPAALIPKFGRYEYRLYAAGEVVGETYFAFREVADSPPGGTSTNL